MITGENFGNSGDWALGTGFTNHKVNILPQRHMIHVNVLNSGNLRPESLKCTLYIKRKDTAIFNSREGGFHSFVPKFMKM